MTILDSLSSYIAATGMPVSIVSVTAVIVVMWICVDFYEEHFG